MLTFFFAFAFTSLYTAKILNCYSYLSFLVDFISCRVYLVLTTKIYRLEVQIICAYLYTYVNLPADLPILPYHNLHYLPYLPCPTLPYLTLPHPTLPYSTLRNLYLPYLPNPKLLCCTLLCPTSLKSYLLYIALYINSIYSC